MQKMIRKYDQLGAIGLFLAALSGHWLITPANQPTATPLQYGWAWAQVLAGLAVALWTHRRARTLKSPTDALLPGSSQ
jgi:hypothetical protein